ncbi:AMP-binding protein [Mycobacterium sp. OTB74]|uniref:AMP-binding protein n=1 Tax=Mycobacterium sp. OTB74 TaxID=1853452 RepID=UPI002475ACD3|nr:AMP-binding protein [Mycobacterium sp. OTB74]MDH6246524.1 acyl-CoA synthetase (AMP-forming)/AMP-acid ligase II [Mycobacterium sp. OTB74]
MTEWTVNAVLDAVATVVPDRTMTVCGQRRSTFAQSHLVIDGLARYLTAQGLGVADVRPDRQRWECDQDRVALIMHNDLYVEAFLACLRARVVPVNINHLYTPTEISDLLGYVAPRAVIYHRSLAPVVAATTPSACTIRIVVDDGSAADATPGSVMFDDAVHASSAGDTVTGSPDDLIMVCTGGTTGRPKGVLWRQADAYISTMTGSEYGSAQEISDAVAERSDPFFAVPPLMHTAGLSTALTAVLSGRTAVVHDNRQRFDPHSVLATAERERAIVMSIVGDAYAEPLATALAERRYDLSALARIGTGGAATHPKRKQALLEQLPHVTIADTYGSSETGGMASGVARHSEQGSTMTMQASGVVLSEDRTRLLAPGEPEIGWIARTGRVPLGYFNDRAATEYTFPVLDGQRLSIPGDRARLCADGTVELLGRDSLVINTGGEKVFVEEVEQVLRGHPAIADAVITSRPHDRWGQEVVAVVAPTGGEFWNAERTKVIREYCATRLARFKVPKDIVVVDRIQRLGNGKADYRWARQAVAVKG